jgi:prolyl-tRNA synthetase
LEEKSEVAYLTTKKAEDFSQWYAEVVIKSKLADYGPVHGTIAFTPGSYSIWEQIQNAFNKMIKETGHKNAYFPLLVPENLLNKEAEHFKNFIPEVFWVTREGDREIKEKYAIRPTSETIIYYFFAKWLRSWRDLPILVNQWCSVLRAEIKDTKPFIRNSEFLWQEGHTAHETPEECEGEVELIINFYKEIAEDFLAIPVLIGRKSKLETFPGASYTYAIEAMMPDGKAVQMGTSHNLAQNFSKPFNLSFLGKDNNQHFAYTTSWGISTRLIGALVMAHGDDNGIIMPPKVASIQVVIVPIFKQSNASEVLSFANSIFDKLKNKFRIEIDLRDGVTPGYKFNDWELRGVPLRMEIGPKDIEKGTVVFARRDNKAKKDVKVGLIEEEISKTLDAIQKSLYDRAKQNLKEHITEVQNYKEFKEVLKSKGGFIKANWCGKDSCETKIKEDTGATNRLIPFDEKKKGKCIGCNEPTDKIAYFAKSY